MASVNNCRRNAEGWKRFLFAEKIAQSALKLLEKIAFESFRESFARYIILMASFIDFDEKVQTFESIFSGLISMGRERESNEHNGVGQKRANLLIQSRELAILEARNMKIACLFRLIGRI